MAKKKVKMDEKVPLMDAINATYGGGDMIIGKASQLMDKVASGARLPTNILGLDLCLYGGFLLGKVVSFVGYESSGKTYCAMKTGASAQHFCRNCLKPEFICDEPTLGGCGNFEPMRVGLLALEGYDMEWGEKIGVNNDELILATPSCTEHAIEIANALLARDEVDVLIWDSIAMSSSIKEQSESVDSSQMGENAKLINKMLRRLNILMINKYKRKLVILINQWRQKLNTTFTVKYRPGGVVQNYVDAVCVEMTGGTYSDDAQKYVNLEFKTKKNKTAPPLKEGGFKLWLSDCEEKAQSLAKSMGQVENESLLLSYLESMGLLTKEKSKYVVAGIDNKFGTKKSIEEYLAYEGMVDYWLLRQQVIAQANNLIAGKKVKVNGGEGWD